jgi:hypothetical protein
MPQNIDYSDVTHAGTHSFEVAPVIPAESYGNREIDPGDPIAATKLDHQYTPPFSQVHGVAAADERRVVHVARAAGEVTAFWAGITQAAVGDSTVTVDLKKNGTSVLTSVITITSAKVAYEETNGAVVTTGAEEYAAGDVFEVVVDATVGTGTLPQGLYAQPVFREAAG